MVTGRPRSTAETPHRPDVSTRDRVLRVAGRLFLRHGYEGAGVKQIVEDSGLTAPSIYWHFGSKVGLLGEFLRNTADRQMKAMLGAVADTDPPERQVWCFIKAQGEFQLSYYEQYDAYDGAFGFVQLYQSLDAETKREVKAIVDLTRERLREILRRGVADGSFEVADEGVVTQSLLVMAEFVYLWFDRDGRLTADEVTSRLADSAVAMVKARGGT